MIHETEAASHDGAMRLGERSAIENTTMAGAVLEALERPEQRDAARLLATLAHDVRQPLTSIRMNVQTAIRLLRERRPRMEVVIGALEDALLAEGGATDVVYAASRQLTPAPNSGRPGPARTMLNAIALDVQRQLRVATSTWGDRLELELDAHAPGIDCDPAQLRGLILSLVLAAFDAIDLGDDSASARISLATQPARGSFAELRLRALPTGALGTDRDFWTHALGAAAARAGKCHTVVESLSEGVTVRVFVAVDSTQSASDEVGHGDAPSGRRR